MRGPEPTAARYYGEVAERVQGHAQGVCQGLLQPQVGSAGAGAVVLVPRCRDPTPRHSHCQAAGHRGRGAGPPVASAYLFR